MGYILVFILGGLALVGVCVALVGGRKRPVGRTAIGHDVSYKQPAADEANPAASDTASDAQAEAARKKTPPA